ncbi:MAG: SIR2 family protein [Gemmatimonadota bacterium]
MPSRFPQELLHSLRSGTLVPMIGSGFSIPSQVPSWSTVIERLLTVLIDDEVPGAEQLLGSFRQGHISHIAAPELTQALRGKYDLRQAIARELKHPFAPSRYHDHLFSTYFDVVITTNWDKIIERHFSDLGRPLQTIVTPAQLRFFDEKTRTQLVKMHGTCDDPDSMIIAADEYANYKLKNRLLFDFMRVTFATKTVLFLGFSLEDPNIRPLLYGIRNELENLQTRTHYAVLYKPNATVRAVLSELNIRIIEPEGPSHSEAYEAWLKEFSSQSVLIGKDNRAKADLVNSELVEATKTPGRTLRMRAALGFLSSPPPEPDAPIYGSAEQDALEHKMTELVETYLRTSKVNQVRCIVHLSPRHQREKGYSRKQLRRRFAEMLRIVNAYPGQVHLAHSPIPVDKNDVILEGESSVTTLKAGLEVGYQSTFCHKNRWTILADVERFEREFDSLRLSNYELAVSLGINVESSEWPHILTVSILSRAVDSMCDDRVVMTCDDDGHIDGEMNRVLAHEEGRRHKSVHVHFTAQVDGVECIVFQRRSNKPDQYKRMLDVAVAGHPQSQDFAREAAREVAEEMGVDIVPADLTLVEESLREDGSDREHVSVFWLDVTDRLDDMLARFGVDVAEVHLVRVEELAGLMLQSTRVVHHAGMVFRAEAMVSQEEFVPGVLEEAASVLGKRRVVPTV